VITLAEQLTAARRELAMRQRVYPNWVAVGKMKQEKADHELACMAAIVETIDKVKMLNDASDELAREFGEG